MDKDLACDVICNVLNGIRKGDIPDAAEMGISMEDYVSIVEAMLRKELIKEAFIIQEEGKVKYVLMTNAELTFHGRAFLAQECGNINK